MSQSILKNLKNVQPHFHGRTIYNGLSEPMREYIDMAEAFRDDVDDADEAQLLYDHRCHDTITIWDDGDRRCEHCIICEEEFIVEKEKPIVTNPNLATFFAALASFVHTAQVELYCRHQQEDFIVLNGKYALVPTEVGPGLLIVWGVDYVWHMLDQWVYRHEPVRVTGMQNKFDYWENRIFLCSDCGNEFYDNARRYEEGTAFTCGYVGNRAFTSKGYDCGLEDYQCPSCGKFIDGGQEIYLYDQDSIAE